MCVCVKIEKLSEMKKTKTFLISDFELLNTFLINFINLFIKKTIIYCTLFLPVDSLVQFLNDPVAIVELLLGPRQLALTINQ